jgi:hypothetical protein
MVPDFWHISVRVLDSNCTVEVYHAILRGCNAGGTATDQFAHRCLGHGVWLGPIRTEGIAGPVTWQARDPRGSGILRETHDGVIVTKSNDREAAV